MVPFKNVGQPQVGQPQGIAPTLYMEGAILYGCPFQDK